MINTYREPTQVSTAGRESVSYVCVAKSTSWSHVGPDREEGINAAKRFHFNSGELAKPAASKAVKKCSIIGGFLMTG
jgi:hypothetical protein